MSSFQKDQNSPVGAVGFPLQQFEVDSSPAEDPQPFCRHFVSSFGLLQYSAAWAPVLLCLDSDAWLLSSREFWELRCGTVTSEVGRRQVCSILLGAFL